jgi:cytochrome c oxidase cbb3-type subunit III
MRKLLKNILMTIAVLLLGTAYTWADGPKPESSMSNPFVVLMVIIILFLALVIAILGRLVLGAANIKADREKIENAKNAGRRTASTIVTTILLFLSIGAFAQDKVPETASSTINGLSPTAYYFITGVAFLELIVIIVLLLMMRSMLSVERKALKMEAAGSGAIVVVPHESWWDRFNKFRPIHQEAAIDLGHNYDGIRELDNRLPPWWLYGFYVSILFGVIYMYRYHIAHSAPLPREEYEIAVVAADKAKADYLKKSDNNVDENSVKLLTDPTSIAAGKQIFEVSCFPCHGKLGEGVVGPNLTDDYWLHGGSVKDIFKTIKYGYPDKGMKSWKDDFSPVQIADLASYIKTLHGTNPPNGKAPQGTLYTEEGAAPSTGNQADSTKKDSTATAK